MLSSLLIALKNRNARMLFVSVFVLSVAAFVNAQAPGSSRGLSSGDGTHTIQGRVFFPSGQALTGMSVKVNLESTNGEGASTSTDQDGSFRFNRVRGGNYAVVVDGGEGFGSAREPVSEGSGGRRGPKTPVRI